MSAAYFAVGAVLGIFTFGFGFIYGWNLCAKQAKQPQDII